MEFRILGPLEVVEGDRVVALGSGKARALLAVLLLHANEVVPSERLIEELWGDAAPVTVAKSVQTYVSHLRRALHGEQGDNGADGLLVTRAGGYVLRLEPGQLDLARFERLVREGRRALEVGEPEQAAESLREALALWRGPPLVDFSYEPFAQQEIARLEELRMAALEERIEADLALSRHAQLTAELETLVAAQPLRERLRGQLMLALYRCDRQVEALEVFRHGRERLVEELGLQPSPALQRLEQAILTHSGELAAAIVKTLRVIVLAEESPEQAVERFLAAKHLLLVADNFEHLLDAAPFIGGLLGACPALTVLVTSREPLALQADERYPVDGLAVADAVTLFCERARAHGSRFVLGDDDMAAVAAICRRVDGLPLAIELAAARCAVLSPSEIAERLEAALAAPGGGVRDAPARQQTLRATIDWSHALLSDEERRCFAGLWGIRRPPRPGRCRRRRGRCRARRNPHRRRRRASLQPA